MSKTKPVSISISTVAGHTSVEFLSDMGQSLRVSASAEQLSDFAHELWEASKRLSLLDEELSDDP